MNWEKLVEQANNSVDEGEDLSFEIKAQTDTTCLVSVEFLECDGGTDMLLTTTGVRIDGCEILKVECEREITYIGASGNNLVVLATDVKTKPSLGENNDF